MATPQVAAPARAASPSSPSLRKRMSLFTRRRTADKRRGSEGDTSMPPVSPLPSLQRQWTLPEQERQALTSPVEAGPVPSSTPTSPSKPTASASASQHQQHQQPRPTLQQAHTFPSTSSPDLEEQQQRFAAHPYLTSASLYPLRGHGRVRSHFSIPDVMVTGCEEEGEETYFEVRLSEDKRRTHLFNHVEPVAIPSGPLSAPLVSPADVLDDGAMTPTPSKRTRKSSLPLIFGRSSTPKPSKASTETHPPRSRSPYQQPAFSSSGSLPSASSRDSLPSTGSTPRTPPLTDGYASSPPDTPSSLTNGGGSEATFSPPPLLPSTRPLVPISKKERKLREREEQALMKELARVDKMVRSHDAKLRKAEMQQQQQSQQKQKQASAGGAKARDTLKRMTRFSVSTKGSAGASATVQAAGSGVVRRSSVNVAKKEATGSASLSSSSRRGKEAPQQVIATGSGSTGPIRPARPPPLFSSQTEAMEIRQSLDLQSQQHKQQQQQARPIPRETRERTKDSDESERPTFTVQEWQDLAEAHFGVGVDVAATAQPQLEGATVSSAAVAGQMTPDGSWELQQPQLAGILEQAGLAELCRQEQRQQTAGGAGGGGVTRRNSRSAAVGVGRAGSQRRASRTGSVLLDGRRRSKLLMGQTQQQQRTSNDDDADGQWEEEDTLTAAALAPFISAGDGEETPRARTPAAVPVPTTMSAVPAQTSPTHFPSLPLLDLGKRMSKGDFASLAAAFEDTAAAPSGGLGMIWPAEAATSSSSSYRSAAPVASAAVSRPPRRAPVTATAPTTSAQSQSAKASNNNGGPSPSSSIDSISSRTSSLSSTDGDSSSSSTSSTPHSSTCHSSSSSTRARREARSSTPPTSSGAGGAGSGSGMVQEKQQFKSRAAAKAAKAAEAAKAGAKVPLPMPSAASPTTMGMGKRMIKRPSPPPL